MRVLPDIIQPACKRTNKRRSEVKRGLCDGRSFRS